MNATSLDKMDAGRKDEPTTGLTINQNHQDDQSQELPTAQTEYLESIRPNGAQKFRNDLILCHVTVFGRSA
jgi:hypothetical protein